MKKLMHPLAAALVLMAGSMSAQHTGAHTTSPAANTQNTNTQNTSKQTTTTQNTTIQTTNAQTTNAQTANTQITNAQNTIPQTSAPTNAPVADAPTATPNEAQQQLAKCALVGEPLQQVPEIVSSNGVLTGTLYAVSEQVALPVRPGGRPGSTPNVCKPQWVRAYRKSAPDPNPPRTQVNPAMPGPTLRARVGDLVQLRFFNQIDYNKFPRADEQCDQSSSYPPPGEVFPDCFSDSVFTNVHYHGTHTSPNSTGDNVFLLVRPSPRKKDGTNAPVITEATVNAAMDDFFRQCAQELNDPSLPQQWPTFWSDVPQSWRDLQRNLLTEHFPDWWRKNENLIRSGLWPQYVAGAYPYCFRLPRYPSGTWPPGPSPELKSADTHGAGHDQVVEAQDPRRPLIMGQAPGTHWYHAHKHGSTSINVMNGMTGVFIIEGEYDDDINAFYGDGWTRTQKLLVIQQLGSVPTMLTSGKGTQSNPDFTVNGQIQPTITMQGGEVQMWRLANTSGRAGVFIQKPPAGFEWRQLAQDGVQFNDSNYQSSLNGPLFMASGNRADILIKAPAFNSNNPAANKYQLVVTNTVNAVVRKDQPPASVPGPSLTLVNIEVVAPAGPSQMQFMPKAPAFPNYLADVADNEVTGSTTLLFASEAGANGLTQHTINGKKFTGEVGASVTLNHTEEWKIVNATYQPGIAHPFHIHVNPFQISEVFDPNEVIRGTTTKRYILKGSGTPAKDQCVLDPTDPATWKPCYQTVPKNSRIWYDVFPIPAGAVFTLADKSTVKIPGYFKMRSRFVDYSGEFVLHCHILAHEDRGMMTGVQVVPLQSPYAHH